MIQNILPFIFHSNNDIQEAGCLVILKLDNFFGDQLGYFANLINLYVKKAYRLQPVENSPFLANIRSLVRKYP